MAVKKGIYDYKFSSLSLFNLKIFNERTYRDETQLEPLITSKVSIELITFYQLVSLLRP